MKSGFDYESDCKFVPIRVEVQCSACEVIGPAVQEVNEGYEVRLVTLQPGVLGIRLVMTRLDTGEQHVEERTVDVMKPDWLNFACFIDDKAVGCETTNPDQSKTTAADPRILTAADPRIVPQAGITGKRAASDSSRFMRVNGKPVPAEATLVGFSLANVFPEARVGEGIAPGLYSIELAIADRMQRYTVLAR